MVKPSYPPLKFNFSRVFREGSKAGALRVMVVQLVARLFELISQCWASLSELTERELDKMAYIVEYSCLSVIDLPANLIRGALILKKELEFRWRFFFFRFVSNYEMEGIERCCIF